MKKVTNPLNVPLKKFIGRDRKKIRQSVKSQLFSQEIALFLKYLHRDEILQGRYW